MNWILNQPYMALLLAAVILLLLVFLAGNIRKLFAKASSEDDIETDMDLMEGHDFEFYCADLLAANGFINIEVTAGSGDMGVDIIAFKDDVKYAIQCKCYEGKVGNSAVQEVFTGARFYNCHVPVAMTNSYFTDSAKELAQKTNVLLWDRDTILRMQ